MNQLDFQMDQSIQETNQAIQQMFTYLEEWEETLHTIENESLKKESMADFKLVYEFVNKTSTLIQVAHKYQMMNPSGGENERLRDQIWKAKQYIRSLGGDWNTVLWTNRKDYL